MTDIRVHIRRRPAPGTPITEYTEHPFGVSNDDASRGSSRGPPVDAAQLLPRTAISSASRRLRRRYSERMESAYRTITVLYDADCGVCRLTVRALERLDWRSRLEIVPLQRFIRSADGDPTRRELRSALHVRDEGGRWDRGGRAALRIASVIPILAPLAVVGRAPGMQGLAEKAYLLVARNRRLISRVLGIE